jgi:DNA polymerase I
MTVLCVDVETSTYNKGAPFDRRNKLICFSWADENGAGADQINEDSLARLANRIAGARVVCGFNIKFDIHWLRKYGITIPEECQVHDGQIAEFILSGQKWRYPSLNESCALRGLGSKLDVVATEYWEKGIQTEDVPWEVLSAYAEMDAQLTLKLYEAQQQIMTPAQKRLCRLQCMDLMILEEMEWNGLRYDHELCEKRAAEIEEHIRQITDELSRIYPGVPINFNSGDHLSAFIYGGTIIEEGKEHVGFYKTGVKAGEPKYKNVEIKHELPRLFTPIRGSELKKEGFYATNADTLLKLKGNKTTKHIIELIQRQVRLDSLLTKTYRGITRANSNGFWDIGWLHGQFNQCTTSTGRLSSSNPNLQNLDGEAQDIFISRYKE